MRRPFKLSCSVRFELIILTKNCPKIMAWVWSEEAGEDVKPSSLFLAASSRILQINEEKMTERKYSRNIKYGHHIRLVSKWKCSSTYNYLFIIYRDIKGEQKIFREFFLPRPFETFLIILHQELEWCKKNSLKIFYSVLISQ